MEKLNLNSAILGNILNDKEAIEELKEYLNAVIDEELMKGDSVDCDLIDECINAISELELENDLEKPNLLVLVYEESFVKQIQRKSILQKDRYRKLAIICASAVLLFAAGSIKTESGQTVAKSTVNKIAYAFGIVDYDQKNEISNVTEIETERTTQNAISDVTESTTREDFTEPNNQLTQQKLEPVVLENIYGLASSKLKTEYTLGEKLDLNGLQIFASYTDGSKKEIPLEKCTVSVPKKFATDVGTYKITITYQNKEYSYDVKVYAEKTSVILNSIYGTFPNDFTFTTDSFENIDMSVVKVTAVYSDGSEKNIPISKCDVTIEENFMDIENKALVTVTYEERSFSFIMTKEER